MGLGEFGRMLLIVALGLAVVGAILFIVGRFTGGRGLPGDIVSQRGGVTVYFPIVTMLLISIIISILLSVILWAINRGR